MLTETRPKKAKGEGKEVNRRDVPNPNAQGVQMSPKGYSPVVNEQQYCDRVCLHRTPRVDDRKLEALHLTRRQAPDAGEEWPERRTGFHTEATQRALLPDASRPEKD